MSQIVLNSIFDGRKKGVYSWEKKKGAIILNEGKRLQRMRIAELKNLTKVDNGMMNVHIEGMGEKRIIFMSGGGTPSPILDFKALYTQFTKQYQIAVVEKFGYGLSDVLDLPRDLDSILNDTREALIKKNIFPPYILCAHSMSGIEALYWVQQFPEEIEAIIGLDMATPKAYEDFKINHSFLTLVSLISKLGIVRLIPGKYMSEAIHQNNLTVEEAKIYKTIFRKRFMSKTMRNEIKEIKSNVRKINEIDIPLLLFVSNGRGTGYKKQMWQQLQKDFHKKQKNSKLILLDCPHYIHHYEYETIAKNTSTWLSNNYLCC